MNRSSLEEHPGKIEVVEPSPSRRINKSEFLQQIHETLSIFTDYPQTPSNDETEKLIELAKKYKASVVLEALYEYQQKKPGRPFRFFLADVPKQEYERIAEEMEKQKASEEEIECPLCGHSVRNWKQQERCLSCFLPLEYFDEHDEISIIYHFDALQDKIRNRTTVTPKYDELLRERGLYKTEKEMNKIRDLQLQELRRSLPWKHEDNLIQI